MHGVAPTLSTRYDVEIAVCKEMHWSFFDFLQAPEDMIEEIMLRLSSDGKWENEKHKRDKAKREAQDAANKSRGRRR